MGSGGRAVLWMGGAAFLGSWAPVGVALGGVGLGMFVFTFWFTLTVCFVWLVCLLVVWWPLMRCREVWYRLFSGFGCWDGLLAVLVGFDILLFVWASFFVDTALVAVVTGGSLVLFVVWRARAGQGRRFRVTVGVWVLFGVGAVSVGLVVLSQLGGVLLVGGWGLVWGFVLSLVVAVLTSFIACRLRLGSVLYQGLGGGVRGLEAGCMVLVSLVAEVPVVLVSGLVVLFRGGGFVSGGVGWVVACTAVATVGTVLFRFGQVEAVDLGVNVLTYFQPILSLLWLGVFVSVGVARLDWLVLGAVGVSAANVLVASRSSQRVG